MERRHGPSITLGCTVNIPQSSLQTFYIVLQRHAGKFMNWAVQNIDCYSLHLLRYHSNQVCRCRGMVLLSRPLGLSLVEVYKITTLTFSIVNIQYIYFVHSTEGLKKQCAIISINISITKQYTNIKYSLLH